MLNTLRSCSIEAEITTSFFLRCNFHNEEQATLQNELRNIDKSLPSVIVTTFADILLCGNKKFNDKKMRFVNV